MYHLKRSHTIEAEIKKSRFMATCVPLLSEDMAESALSRLRRADATHNCWAYRLGQSYRFNDDGEPGGTAGKPMLEAIDAMEFDCVLAVVTRYFGGIKLGAGGLVRAYRNAVLQCLRESEYEAFVPKTELRFGFSYDKIYAVYGVIRELGLVKRAEEHGAEGVEMTLTVEVNRVSEAESALLRQCKGGVVFYRG